ncbi:ABC transporter ATP-binding protein [Pedobacter nutrimenti]|uniref:ABC-2 type transport system ATP-binding protein n=1 Tax=Pedobacter nutrimenti TaxID=1241337 RepID=A0A318UHR5_9SPHI|nr:ATP-binding cassette domain-containing protein [Pedobacter nutrimenti]PYF76006.1 ABC-2 type transport system ATP-binding protein [Pedobacter nutrimenti]
MNSPAIQTCGLNYHFGDQKVIENLSLEVNRGSIYGFLGPNGAGKTTTIKILLNLLKSPKDTVFVFGRDMNTYRTANLKKIGALVEQPAIYAHMTGKENLLNRCMLLGLSKNKASEILELVGLGAAAHKKTGQYSLGMKQRLGIGLALLPDPELLLLDEPTNGLDPNGIIEIRSLMIELATKHEKTILVSSHLLSEIEKTATHVGIINKGQLLFQGTIEDLHLLNKPVLTIELNNTQAAAQLLSREGYHIEETKADQLTLEYSSAEQSSQINSLLVQNGFNVSSLHPIRKALEELFLDITKTNN